MPRVDGHEPVVYDLSVGWLVRCACGYERRAASYAAAAMTASAHRRPSPDAEDAAAIAEVERLLRERSPPA